jgi:hypothetical protein
VFPMKYNKELMSLFLGYPITVVEKTLTINRGTIATGILKTILHYSATDLAFEIQHDDMATYPVGPSCYKLSEIVRFPVYDTFLEKKLVRLIYA